MIQNKSFQNDFDKYVLNSEMNVGTATCENFMKISCYLGNYKQMILKNTPKHNLMGLLSEIGSSLNI